MQAKTKYAMSVLQITAGKPKRRVRKSFSTVADPHVAIALHTCTRTKLAPFRKTEIPAIIELRIIHTAIPTRSVNEGRRLAPTHIANSHFPAATSVTPARQEQSSKPFNERDRARRAQLIPPRATAS